MSTSPIQRHHAVPASHRGVVLAVWAVATLAVAVLGWLVLALSERGGDRLAGGLLLLAAAVAAVATVAQARAAGPAWVPAVASAGLVLDGLFAGAVMLSAENVFASDVLLAGGVPVLAGVVTAGLVLRSRRA